ncbi:MAG: DUF362 domain-containing protein [Acidobacteriia bacterium]|nr:DUF362 domain-containing protein [Terriglobia bacterium]
MNTVAAVRVSEARYPLAPPFGPAEAYPEYPFGYHIAREPNPAYAGVRRLFELLNYDHANRGTAAWNPLRHIIEPGMTVVLKPNFVLSAHKDGKNLFAIVTHPAVLRAIADYVWIALGGHGKIVIADAPQYDCDFPQLIEATRLDEVIAFYNGFRGPAAQLLDLRPYASMGKHFASLLKPLPGDPLGSILVNLGRRSALYGCPHPEKLYGAVYHREETIAHHTGETHEYLVSRTIMDADVVVSVPKLKVHKKVGVTLNVKGLVGINTNKNYLVHYSITPPSEGGDQYPDGLLGPVEKALISTERWMYDHLLAPRKPLLEYLHRSLYWLHNHTTRRLGIKVEERKRLLDAGNWYGNDSAWRMAADLYTLFLFAGSDGLLHRTPQRRAFSIVDGIVGGDINGPLTPDPVASGVLLGGENLLAVDLVATRLMGFDPLKLKTYQGLLANREFDFGVHGLQDIQVASDDPSWTRCLTDPSSRFLGFRPHPGWAGHLEVPAGELAGV